MSLRTNVRDVVRFYDEYPEFIGRLSVETRNGYKPIEFADITAFDSTVVRVTSETKQIEASPDHLLWINGKWTAVKDIRVMDDLSTVSGEESVISVEVLPFTEDLYDFQVEGKEFIANGVVTHNSTMLDAICFALYGKAYRNINKPQLTNSITKKNCLVEVDFSIGSNEYIIKRGLKPAVFEIWVNSVLINQDAASKDYQDYLENAILKLNYKSFTQIIVLGSAAFIPFMQLTPATRREIIEDLLDIKIFSEMNEVLKERVSDWKESLKTTDTKIQSVKERSELQKNHLKTLTEDRDERIVALQKKRTDTEDSIFTLKHNIKAYETDYTVTPRVARQALEQAEASIKKLEFQLQHTIEALEKLEANPVCASCGQPTKPEILEQQRKPLIEKKAQQERILHTTKVEIQLHIPLVKEEDEAYELQKQKQDHLIEMRTELRVESSQLRQIEEELEDLLAATGNIDEEKSRLREMAKEGKLLVEKKNALLEEKDYLDAATSLLKDSGIKTRIIKQYVPVINQLVNKYLRFMDFFVSFELDEQFKEHIRSRHRDDFSYESFSEGEKQRIDLALTFTWRAIAQSKNSAHTNLFLLDEVFDSSLDMAGTEYLMSMLNTIGDGVNVWVISHKGDHLHDKFKNVVRVVKRKNFSVVQ